MFRSKIYKTGIRICAISDMIIAPTVLSAQAGKALLNAGPFAFGLGTFKPRPAYINKPASIALTQTSQIIFRPQKRKSSMFIRNTLFSAALLACSTMNAFGNDTALYAEPAPKDASFLRFVGFDSDTVQFAGKTFDLIEAEKNNYIPVSSSLLENGIAGAYITVSQNPDGTITTIAEGQRNDPSKVFLVLVNASDQPLELRLADGSVAVIKDVATNTSNLRGVNPVAIKLGVFAMDAETPIATFDVALQRGQNITFLADSSGVQLIENRFGAVSQ
jgi:hypothetical protein